MSFAKLLNHNDFYRHPWADKYKNSIPSIITPAYIADTGMPPYILAFIRGAALRQHVTNLQIQERWPESIEWYCMSLAKSLTDIKETTTVPIDIGGRLAIHTNEGQVNIDITNAFGALWHLDKNHKLARINPRTAVALTPPTEDIPIKIEEYGISISPSTLASPSPFNVDHIIRELQILIEDIIDPSNIGGFHRTLELSQSGGYNTIASTSGITRVESLRGLAGLDFHINSQGPRWLAFDTSPRQRISFGSDDEERSQTNYESSLSRRAIAMGMHLNSLYNGRVS